LRRRRKVKQLAPDSSLFVSTPFVARSQQQNVSANRIFCCHSLPG